MTSNSEALAFFASARRSLQAFTPAGLFGEACSLVMGYDWGVGRWVLDGFQEWMGARHGGRSEVAFWVLLLRELFPDDLTITTAKLTPDQELVAIDRLFELLAEWLSDGTTLKPNA